MLHWRLDLIRPWFFFVVVVYLIDCEQLLNVVVVFDWTDLEEVLDSFRSDAL